MGRCAFYRNDVYSPSGRREYGWVQTRNPPSEPLPVELTEAPFVTCHPEDEPLRRQTPPPAPEQQMVSVVVCKRAGCMAGMPLEEQLERLLGNETSQHNRGKGRIAKPLQFRTAICKHAKKGHCCYGSLCWMAHSEAELRTKEMNIADGINTMEAVSAFIQKAVEAKCDSQTKKFACKMVPDFDEEPALMDGARVGGQIATANSIRGEAAM